MELPIRKDTLNTIKANMEKTQIKMKILVDKGRGHTEFNKGDWVFVKLQPYR